MQSYLFGANKIAPHGKRITDATYGSIIIDKAHLSILDSKEMQRLHYIKQGASFFVFPNSVHDRFSHSLGTMHIGRNMINAFLLNTERFIIEHQNLPNISPYILPAWNQLKNCGLLTRLANTFVVACLLHDVGHAPFSHTTEDYFRRATSKYDELVQYLCNVTGDTISLCDDKIKPHECVSAYMACHESSNINKLLKQVNACGGYRSETDNLNQDDTVHIARMILGCVPQKIVLSERPNVQEISLALLNALYRCAVLLLNSDAIDADKIDYLVRDCYCSGYTNIEVNHERIINGLTACFEITNLQDMIDSITIAFLHTDLQHAQGAMWARLSQKRYWHNNQTAKYYDYAIKTALDGVLTVLQDVVDRRALSDFIAQNNLGDANDAFIRYLFDPTTICQGRPTVLPIAKNKKRIMHNKGCWGIALPNKPLTDDCIIQLFKFYSSLWDELNSIDSCKKFFSQKTTSPEDNNILFKRAALMKTLVDDIFERRHLNAVMKTSIELDTLAREAGLAPDDLVLKAIFQFLNDMSVCVDHSLKRSLAGSVALIGNDPFYEPLIAAISAPRLSYSQWAQDITVEVEAVINSGRYGASTIRNIIDDCTCDKFAFSCFDDYIAVKLALYLGKDAFTNSNWATTSFLWDSIMKKRYLCHENIMETNPENTSGTLMYQQIDHIAQYIVDTTLFLPDYDFSIVFTEKKLTGTEKETLFRFLYTRFKSMCC